MGEEDYQLVEEQTRDGKLLQCLNESEAKSSVSPVAEFCRKDRRKVLKKEKRRQKRKEAAENARQQEEARLNDPEEQRRIELEEEREKERLERERREFEEKERLFLEALARRKAQEVEEEKERKRADEAQKLNENQVEGEMEANEDDEWDYVEEGPPEIIWQGNEIIVKKNKVKVKKKVSEPQIGKEDPDRPTSNPLLPQFEAFADFKSRSTISAQQLLENVAQQVPNFGTEQDKAHCPFHLKTGACRFGPRCSRVHFYPDKSCTLLIKHMYNGPGLTWEQDEGLEYTDEEVERSYEEFYEDVHTEFLKFGEIINFKVCRNVSTHLRGNVYVHYVSLDDAVLAYHATNGRYFAGKQVSCEFVGVTRWKVAICGEYMKSKLKTCSRGSACNFIHCFRNPGGDYEWADWDKPAPKYWAKKMAALFGYSHEYVKGFERESPAHHGSTGKRLATNAERYHSRRSQPTEMKSSNRSPSASDHYEKGESRRNKYWRRHTSDDVTRPEFPDEREYQVERYSTNHERDKKRQRQYDSESDRDLWDRHDQTRKTSRRHHDRRLESHDGRETQRSGSFDTLSDSDPSDRRMNREKQHKHPKKRSRKHMVFSGSGEDNGVDSAKERSYSSSDTCSGEQSHENRKSSSSKDHLHRNRRTHGSDSSDGITQSSHDRRRMLQANRNEVSGLSPDHRDSRRSLRNKHPVRESDLSESNPQTGQKESRSDKGDRFHSSRKDASFDHPDKQEENIDNVDEGESHKQRRKSHGKSRLQNQSNDHPEESRSTSTSKRRHSKHKRKTSSRQRDSNED